jgi:hypothetical protein
MNHRDAVLRARAEFLEMPDLYVTPEEASRLWQVDVTVCASVLDELARAGLIIRTGKKYKRR